GTYASPSPIALRVMRVSPPEEPKACGGSKRSIPSTRAPRAASWWSVALPAAPRPTTIASYVLFMMNESVRFGARVLGDLRPLRDLALHESGELGARVAHRR